MTDAPAPGSRAPIAALDAWRARSTSIALVGALIVDLPALVFGVATAGSLELRLIFLACYAGIAVLAVLRGLDWRHRAGGLLAIGYAIAVLMLAHAGLVGSGRVVLLGLPLLALLLLGRAAGLVTVCLSIAIYAAFFGLAIGGWTPPLFVSQDGRVWLAQGLGLLMLLAPLALLLDRTLAFQAQMIARAEAGTAARAAELEERRVTVRRLEEAAAKRGALEQRLLEIGELERRKSAQQLHDGVCQQLTAGVLGARMLERALASRGAPEAAQAEALAELVEATLVDSRRFVHGLYPGPLPSSGLGAALRELARHVRETVEVDCEVRIDEEPALPGLVASQLYRIAQEATWNAVRHASATRIELGLARRDGALVLSVRDDGRGMGGAEPGIGQRSMADRAQSIGATLQVGDGPGGGVEVVCAVPLVEEGSG